MRHYLRAQSQGHHTTDRLEERGVERGSARRSSLKRTRERHRQSDEHWNRFKGHVGETSERRGGAHMGFSERMGVLLSSSSSSLLLLFLFVFVFFVCFFLCFFVFCFVCGCFLLLFSLLLLFVVFQLTLITLVRFAFRSLQLLEFDISHCTSPLNNPDG